MEIEKQLSEEEYLKRVEKSIQKTYHKVLFTKFVTAIKEYQLLEYLMLNQGKILTKESLIFKVWGPLGEPDYNNLEVYVSFIRKKMKFVNASCKIVTTKNVGYSLEK